MQQHRFSHDDDEIVFEQNLLVLINVQILTYILEQINCVWEFSALFPLERCLYIDIVIKQLYTSNHGDQMEACQ